MKSPPTEVEDHDDIFGPPRTSINGHCHIKNRPSMISGKYRLKEERRKVIRICCNKLKRIEDPEANLRRSVLINNTLRRLQNEAREEKLQKQHTNYPRCYESDNFVNLRSEFIKNEMKNSSTYEDMSYCGVQSKLIDSLNQDFAIENDFDSKVAEEIRALDSESTKNNIEVLHGLDLVEDSLNNFSVNSDDNRINNVNGLNNNSDGFSSRKRSFDDMEDCDVQDVLSQFYMPPTPRMLTCIDEDEEVNVVDDEPLPKRIKTDEVHYVINPERLSRPMLLDSVSTSLPHFESSTNVETSYGLNLESSKHCDTMDLNITISDESEDAFHLNNVNNNNNFMDMEMRSRNVGSHQNIETDTNSYSCGQASMFNELQNNVFHNLIASLET